jgi:disulfide bond formation protein DsbB
MTEQAQIATQILVFLTLAMDVLIVLLVGCWIFARHWLYQVFRASPLCARCIAALCALCALVGSMIYSAVTGFAPCPLCITSRILVGLLVVTLPLPSLRPSLEGVTHRFGIAFSILGMLVSGYQYVLQWMALTGTHLPCPAIEGLPTCDRIYFIEFGFVTIPFVAFSTFVLIFVLLVLHKKTSPSAPAAESIGQ